MKIVNYILLFLIFTPLIGNKMDQYNILTNDSGEIVLKNLPKTEYSTQIKDLVKKENPVLVIEALFHVDVEKGLSRIEELNKITNISNLKGVEYYSETEKRYKVFVKDAYTMGSSGKPTSDKQFKDLNDSITINSLVKDSRFGKLNYKIDYFNTQDSFGMIMENRSKISYLLVPLVQPGEAKLLYQIIPSETGYQFYGITIVKTETPSFLDKRLSKSIYNRMVAVINWFVDSVEAP